MPTRGTIHRTVRIDDALWEQAKAKADADGVNLSEVIRAALRAYVQGQAGVPFVPPK
jgi:antitoxin component of RelBE/YafQ-DinJ toxin-antitoxin module